MKRFFGVASLVVAVMIALGTIPVIPYLLNADHINAGVLVILAVKVAVIYGLWRLYLALR